MTPEWSKFWKKLLPIVEVHCRQECDVLNQVLRNLVTTPEFCYCLVVCSFPFKNTPET